MKIGTRVQRIVTGRTGTTVGEVRKMRTAGEAAFVRVRWDSGSSSTIPVRFIAKAPEEA